MAKQDGDAPKNIIDLLRGTLDDHLGKEEFLGAFKTVVDYVKKIEADFTKAFTDLATALTTQTQETQQSINNALVDLQMKVNNLFVKERLDAMDTRIDGRLATLKDGKQGAKGERGDRGDDGKDGSPDTAAQVRDKLESLQGEDRLHISAIDGLADVLKKFKKQIGGGGASYPVAHWPLHEHFTMDGVATTVTLSQGGISAQGNACFVRYQGQLLDHGVQYTVDGNKITLVGFVPEVDTVISVTYWP